MEVGLAEMSGVAGFGEQTQIRQPEFLNQSFTCQKAPMVSILLIVRMDDEKTCHNQTSCKHKYQEYG